MVDVFREMFRVARQTFLAESLPVAKSEAQRAHLAMYNLREEVFRATSGRPDDLPYLPIERIATLLERAGGVVDGSEILDVDLPHALAYFPRSYVEAIPDDAVRAGLLTRWDHANALRVRFGADHSPVGIVSAHRS